MQFPFQFTSSHALAVGMVPLTGVLAGDLMLSQQKQADIRTEQQRRVSSIFHYNA